MSRTPVICSACGAVNSIPLTYFTHAHNIVLTMYNKFKNVGFSMFRKASRIWSNVNPFWLNVNPCPIETIHHSSLYSGFYLQLKLFQNEQ